MEIKVQSSKLNAISSQALVLIVFKNQKDEVDLGSEGQEINSLLNNALVKTIKSEFWKAEVGQVLTCYGNDKLKTERIILIGGGKFSECTPDTLRVLASYIISKAKSLKCSTLSLVIEEELVKKFEAQTIVSSLSDGFYLGSYKFLKYKTEELKNHQLPEKVSLVFSAQKINLKETQNAIEISKLFCSATNFTRDLVNEMPSIATPKYLANVASGLKNKMITVKVYNKNEIKKMKMGGVLGVSAGSNLEPYFVHLIYKPEKVKSSKKIALLGKGITFDSGGLSLKGSDHMETMKLDMAGAAVVLGVFKVLQVLKPKIEIHGIMAFCENMPSGTAIKPGDILTTMKGKTIEVLNTDAEGRLILADSLCYATNLKPDYMIDLATLTGACMVALGEQVAGLMSNNDKLTEMIKKASKISGEKIWELPLVPEYKSLIKSEVADVRNTSKSRYGGTITAGLFLEEFTENIPWAHIDIAGPAWAETIHGCCIAKGATGFGVRTILTLVSKVL